MDWTVYRFMLPACVVIAATATFSGISGAALMTSMFILVFPWLGVPTLSTVQSIGAALFLETAGFGAGVYHYARMRIADLRMARALITFSAPSAVVGALLAHEAPATVLRIAYGIAMLGLARLLGRGNGRQAEARKPAVPCPLPGVRVRVFAVRLGLRSAAAPRSALCRWQALRVVRQFRAAAARRLGHRGLSGRPDLHRRW